MMAASPLHWICIPLSVFPLLLCFQTPRKSSNSKLKKELETVICRLSKFNHNLSEHYLHTQEANMYSLQNHMSNIHVKLRNKSTSRSYLLQKLNKMFKFLCMSGIHFSQFDGVQVWSMLLHTLLYIIWFSILNSSRKNNLYCLIIALLQSPLENTVHL